MKRYPAIFVDEVLVATPKDFGWYGKGEGEGEGRYAPLKSAQSHERFRGDLGKIVRLVLAGRTADARAAAPSQKSVQIAELLAGEFAEGDTIRVDAEDDALVFERASEPVAASRG